MPFLPFIAPESVHSTESVARVIDHTLLKPDATRDAVLKLCDAALTHRFYSVCVNPSWIPLCAEKLKSSDVLPITVVGFPLGANATATKIFETEDAIQNGAREIDMVLNVGALKSDDKNLVRDDIAAVVKASGKMPVKVILETALLTDAEKILACKLSVEAGAAYVKTSTGFAATGATVADIRLMRETVGKNIGVKASGGIRSFKDLQNMIEAGASRVGASASVAILQEAKLHFQR